MSTLYHHKTDGGAEYLCTSPIEGTDEGDLYTAIVRLDGEPELLNPVYVTISELLENLRAVMSSLEEAVHLTDQSKHYNLRWKEEIRAAYSAIRKAEGE